MASVSCASVEMEPSDIAPVAKRLTISLAGSTSSTGIASRPSVRKLSSPRSVARRVASWLTWAENSAYLSAASPFPDRTACWSSAIDSGFHMWCSPSRRQA
jgi:hypothetical protein